MLKSKPSTCVCVHGRHNCTRYKGCWYMNVCIQHWQLTADSWQLTRNNSDTITMNIFFLHYFHLLPPFHTYIYIHYVYNIIAVTVTIAFNVLLASFCFSPGHLTVATSSLTPSKKQELAEYTPAPFFCMIRHVTAVEGQRITMTKEVSILGTQQRVNKTHENK